MKKTIKKHLAALFFACLVSTTPLFAFEDSVKVNDDHSISLYLTGFRTQTHIRVKDKHDRILYKETIDSSSSFVKKFDLELLPKGNYWFEIEDDQKTKSMVVGVWENGLVFDELKVREYYKPVVNKRDEWVYISQFSPRMKSLDVEIFDTDDELIFSDRVKGETAMGKIYDFSRTLPGTYRIYLESDGQASQHWVTISR